jgi:acetylornithine/succinyldiaminopimelate/putrescine aminotransferase
MKKTVAKKNIVLQEPSQRSLYTEASNTLLNTIKGRIAKQQVNFLLSTNPIFAESAQMACAFSYYLSQHSSGQETSYKTFFCNSSYEAVQGAIKIARHKSLGKIPGGRVVIFDQGKSYNWVFDPLGLGDARALVPGITVVSEKKDVDITLDSQDKLVALVCVFYPQISDEWVRSIREKCVSQGAIFILDTSQSDIQGSTHLIERLGVAFDIVIWGEQLTNYEVPVGAFSMREPISRPWNTLNTCFTHSSTYGGNGLSMSVAKQYFPLNFPQLVKDQALQQAWKDIENSQDKKIKAFSRYINSISPIVYKTAKLDLEVVRAHGAVIDVKDKQGNNISILDYVGGCGCALRGHNPQDVIGEVLDKHQIGYSYWSDISGRLKDISGFSYAFPAVSGATAVEIALGLALAANTNRKKVITFKGNYAGKTLVSLNGTWGKDIHDPFAPLYPHTVFIDPSAPNAQQELEKELQSGEVALVFFEGMQGKALEIIPESLVKMIAQYKKAQGYYIGVDEVLNGFFRTGDFLSYNSQVMEPDIVTLSKGISDMIFPMAVTLVSKNIYENAQAHYPQLVSQYGTRYLNQLGAHIGLHALNKAVELDISSNVKKMGNMLQAGLRDIAKKSPMLKDAEGKGLHLHLCIEAKKFPFNVLGKQFSEMVISRLCFTEGKTLLFFGRLLPPLNIQEHEVKQGLAAIEKVFSKSKFSIFCAGAGQMGALIGRVFMSTLGGRLGRNKGLL